MKNLSIISLLLFVFVLSENAYAQRTGAGAGLIVGGPTGLSGKFWTSDKNAIDVAFGWSDDGHWVRLYNGWYYSYSNSYFHFHADYLWHDFSLIKSTTRLPVYYGLGVHLDEGNAFPTAFGFRGVLGIDWMPISTPLDVFVEFAPVLYLAPVSALGLDAGIGARFFFH